MTMPDYNDPSYWLSGDHENAMPDTGGRYAPLVIVYSPFTRRVVWGRPSNWLWLAVHRAKLLALWTDLTVGPADGLGIGWAVRDRHPTNSAG